MIRTLVLLIIICTSCNHKVVERWGYIVVVLPVSTTTTINKEETQWSEDRLRGKSFQLPKKNYKWLFDDEL